MIDNPNVLTFNRREYKKLTQNQYSKEKFRLQVELLKLQESIIKKKSRVALLFDGRDAAGKGSTIKRFIEHLIPKAFRVVQLGIPTPDERENWFERYEKHLPKPGEIVFFDRSWYNRALVEPTMGYCSLKQYEYFMANVNQWEQGLIDGGLTIIKFYLSIKKDRQLFRFEERKNSPLKYWKYSDNDSKIASQFDRYTFFKEKMFQQTATKSAPWIVVDSDVKMIARLNAIRFVLSQFDYPGKTVLKEKSWTTENPQRSIDLDGVIFENLTLEQIEILKKYRDA